MTPDSLDSSAAATTALIGSMFEQRPGRAFERLGERFERGNLDALQGGTTQDVVGGGDGQSGKLAELVCIRELAPIHVPRDGGEVPSNHELQASLNFPLAQIFKLAYNSVTPQRTVTMTTSFATYAPGLRKVTPVDLIVADALNRWPACPRAALQAHLTTLQTVLASCPAVSRRGAWGARHESHMTNIEEAIKRLPAVEG